MTVEEELKASGLARLDAEVLMASVLGKTRTWLLAHCDEVLTKEHAESFKALAARRKAHEPISYITGTREFFGRDFFVTRDVLIPRPATEELAELALRFLTNAKNETVSLDSEITGMARKLGEGSPSVLLDIGTGSGCIAITLKLEGRKERIVAVDTSKNALEIAKKNAEFLHADNIAFVCEDGAKVIASMNEPFVMVSNPPYIPSHTELMNDVRLYEPAEALFAGSDGLSVIRTLVTAAKNNPMCLGIAMELREDQCAAVDRMLGA